MTTEELKMNVIEEYNNGDSQFGAFFQVEENGHSYACDMVYKESRTDWTSRKHFAFNYRMDGKRIARAKLAAIIG